MPLVYVALGSNLADPAAQIRAALEKLARLPHSRLLRASSLYRTAPVGIHGQPDFINAVAAFETMLSPEAFLATLFAIEAEFGRRRDFPLAPRILDLDLLLYDTQTINSPRLVLPHPRMHLRRFVLEPLVDISNDCDIPGRGSAAAWLAAVSLQRIDKLVS